MKIDSLLDITSTVILDLQAAYRFNKNDAKLKAALLEVLKYYMTPHEYEKYLSEIKNLNGIDKIKID